MSIDDNWNRMIWKGLRRDPFTSHIYKNNEIIGTIKLATEYPEYTAPTSQDILWTAVYENKVRYHINGASPFEMPTSNVYQLEVENGVFTYIIEDLSYTGEGIQTIHYNIEGEQLGKERCYSLEPSELSALYPSLTLPTSSDSVFRWTVYYEGDTPQYILAYVEVD